MNREEAIEEIRYYCQNSEEIIQALEQEPTTKNNLSVDCIDRAQAQTEIELNASRYTLAKERGSMGKIEWSGLLIKVGEAVDIIRSLPSVTPTQKWIPVSEKLPEDGELILFSTKTDRVFEGRFFVDKTDLQWYAFRDKAFAYNNVVTAWLPVPKPYKEEEK